MAYTEGMSSTTVIKNERLDLRLTSPQKRLIERAAQVRGSSLSEFSVQAVVDRAEEVLTQRTDIHLDEADWAAFCAALDHPAQVLPGLRELMARPSVFA